MSLACLRYANKTEYIDCSSGMDSALSPTSGKMLQKLLTSAPADVKHSSGYFSNSQKDGETWQIVCVIAESVAKTSNFWSGRGRKQEPQLDLAYLTTEIVVCASSQVLIAFPGCSMPMYDTLGI